MLEFKSFVGHQPWFFVSDTGTPGGSATLTGPDGTVEVCVNTQVSTKPRDWYDEDGTLRTTAHAVGFEVPGIFLTEGAHVLTVVQDDVVTEYAIDVVLDIDELLNHDGRALGVLNQIRRLAHLPAFTLDPKATAAGFTDRELAVLNEARYKRGVPTIAAEG